jgi:hypothetical protein
MSVFHGCCSPAVAYSPLPMNPDFISGGMRAIPLYRVYLTADGIKTLRLKPFSLSPFLQ